MDSRFFLPLLAGLLFLGIGLVGLRTGIVLASHMFFVRRTSPAYFWSVVVLWLGAGTLLLAVAFYYAAHV